MSCWVVPTIAAEVWGVSIDHVLQRIRVGELPYRVDEGFMFVDVMPPPPPTFTVLSEAEVEGLREAEGTKEPPEPQLEPQPRAEPEPTTTPLPASQHDEVDELDSPGNDEASVDLGDWRAARRRVGMTRVPPGRRAAPQAA